VSVCMCGCFGNMCTCICCVLYCLYCVFYCSLCIFFLFVLSVLVQGLLPPSDNSIAVNNNNNNNNNNQRKPSNDSVYHLLSLLRYKAFCHEVHIRYMFCSILTTFLSSINRFIFKVFSVRYKLQYWAGSQSCGKQQLASSCPSVGLSVCPHGITRLLVDDFPEIWYLRIFPNFCTENSSDIKIWKE
jgi:hypothetical protein